MSSRKKVLVVENDCDWQSYLRDCLEQKAYDVVIESNYDAAKERVAREKFDFVTTNMQSELQGWDLIEAIHKVPDNSPIMVITGNPELYVRQSKKIEKEIFLIEKGKFSRKQFIEIVSKELATP